MYGLAGSAMQRVREVQQQIGAEITAKTEIAHQRGERDEHEPDQKFSRLHHDGDRSEKNRQSVIIPQRQRGFAAGARCMKIGSDVISKRRAACYNFQF